MIDDDTLSDTSLDTPVDAPESLDDLLNNAYDGMEHDEPAQPEQVEAKPPKARDVEGKFTKQAAEAKANQLPQGPPPSTAVDPAITAPTPVAAPNTWTPAAKAKFGTLDPEVQNEIVKREKEMSRAITAHDQDRTFGKTLRDVVGPYMPMINSEGSTPEIAIQSMLNTAYKLRNSTPQEKGVLLANLARQYGADLSAFTGDPDEQAYVDPIVQALQQKVQQLEGYLTQQHTQQQSFSEQNVLRDIEKFGSDPAHPHFEAVGQKMADLIKAGIAADLQDAYDQAIYMLPEVRQQVISAQQTDAQRKQIEDAKNKAARARQLASVNLNSRPSPVPAKTMSGSIDQTLHDTYESLMGSA